MEVIIVEMSRNEASVASSNVFKHLSLINPIREPQSGWPVSRPRFETGTS
jgi:hypothetical protein